MHNPKSVRPAVAKWREFFMTCREMSRIFMTFYDALILQKQTYFVAKCRIFYDERPKSIRTWSGLSKWKMTQPKSSENRCA